MYIYLPTIFIAYPICLYSLTPPYVYSLYTDSSLLRTLFFVPGEGPALNFPLIHPLNTDTS